MLGPAVAKSSMRKIFTWILTGVGRRRDDFCRFRKTCRHPEHGRRLQRLRLFTLAHVRVGCARNCQCRAPLRSSYAFIGAASIVCIMVVQLYSHMAHAQVDKAAPAAVLLALAVVPWLFAELGPTVGSHPDVRQGTDRIRDARDRLTGAPRSIRIEEYASP